MKKKVSIIFLIVFAMFFFINKVSADNTGSKICLYESGNGKFYFKNAKLNLKNRKVTIRKVAGPNITAKEIEMGAADTAIKTVTTSVGTAAGIAAAASTAGATIGSTVPVIGTIAGGILGAGVGYLTGTIYSNVYSKNAGYVGANVVDVNGNAIEYKVKNKAIAKKLILFDENGSRFKIDLPDLTNSCSEYLGVVINDLSGTKNSNFQIVMANQDTKDVIDGYVNQYSNYNYVIWGTRTQSQAQNPDDLGDSEPSQDFDTCDGLLGVKTDGEYEEGSVGFLLQEIFNYMKIAVIALIFGFSIKDYVKAISSQDQDLFKKANKQLIKRLALGIIFFLIPEIVDIIVGIVDSNTCGIK